MTRGPGLLQAMKMEAPPAYSGVNDLPHLAFPKIVRDRLYYLASPISGTLFERNERIRQVWQAQAVLLTRGVLTYAPHAHFRDVCDTYDLPRDWSFWEWPSFNVLKRCDGLICLQLAGWDKSIGVGAELDLARKEGLDVLFMRDPADASSLSEMP